MRRAQSATEYMFILAATLVLVAYVSYVVISAMEKIVKAVTIYIDQTRKAVLENL